MTSHLTLIRQSTQGKTIKASGEAIGFAVALTEDEIITARAGLFGRWGAKVQRYPLNQLTDLRVVPNPTANLLALDFNGVKGLTVMYGRESQAAFDEIVAALRKRLGRSDDNGK